MKQKVTKHISGPAARKSDPHCGPMHISESETTKTCIRKQFLDISFSLYFNGKYVRYENVKKVYTMKITEKLLSPLVSRIRHPDLKNEYTTKKQRTHDGCVASW